MTDFMDEYRNHCEQYGTPERIELLLCDLNGVLRGKWLPGDQVDKMISQDVRLPISTYAPNIMGAEPPETGLGIVAGDPDGIIVPIGGTLKPVPWANAKVAQVLVEMEDAGSLSKLSTRGILNSLVEKFADNGMQPVVATELEFYVHQVRNNNDDAPVPPKRTPDAQNYDMDVLARHADMLDEIQNASAVQGLPTDTLIAEYGPGQFEINFHHTGDVLAAADTALLFRRLVRGVVAKHGLEATFMAKPYADQPGNGMHVHASVLDSTGKNLFTADKGVAPDLSRAVAGVLATMRDLQAIFAPHLNSYRRFQPNSFAPATPDWGFDNRAAAVRLPQTSGAGARLEHRISGADVNPYLVLAAILGGIWYGLKTEITLPPPLDSSASVASQPLSHDWQTAVAQFAASDVAADIFGTYYRDIYAAVRRDEIANLCSEITPTEYRYYLSRF